jgi:hypothetical protein
VQTHFYLYPVNPTILTILIPTVCMLNNSSSFLPGASANLRPGSGYARNGYSHVKHAGKAGGGSYEMRVDLFLQYTFPQFEHRISNKEQGMMKEYVLPLA